MTKKIEPRSRWRKLMRSRRYRLEAHGRRKVAGMCISTVGIQPADYVELKNIRITTAYDGLPKANGKSELMTTRWRVAHGKDGICWSVSPTQERNLDALVGVERKIAKGAGTRRVARHKPIFPEVWAGFRTNVAASCRFQGLEYERHRKKFRWPNEVLRRIYQRKDIFGLTLLPAMWVLADLAKAVAVFAKLGDFPRSQAFRLSDCRKQLVGNRSGHRWNFSCERPRFKDAPALGYQKTNSQKQLGGTC